MKAFVHRFLSAVTMVVSCVIVVVTVYLVMQGGIQ